ncbi:hypothetical protein CCUS01_07312 [Colletotrichum cuscutae]|uniref:Uncharacterized protein n=1 Tax=Colletotrichum cuscutae TaxID=1209917 RepID=A0AAI9UX68_9PEZI|nr:hypothetical protein CCUS01_07312 [Colletotrichum cuscutae]
MKFVVQKRNHSTFEITLMVSLPSTCRIYKRIELGDRLRGIIPLCLTKVSTADGKFITPERSSTSMRVGGIILIYLRLSIGDCVGVLDCSSKVELLEKMPLIISAAENSWVVSNHVSADSLAKTSRLVCSLASSVTKAVGIYHVNQSDSEILIGQVERRRSFPLARKITTEERTPRRLMVDEADAAFNPPCFRRLKRMDSLGLHIAIKSQDNGGERIGDANGWLNGFNFLDLVQISVNQDELTRYQPINGTISSDSHSQARVGASNLLALSGDYPTNPGPPPSRRHGYLEFDDIWAPSTTTWFYFLIPAIVARLLLISCTHLHSIVGHSVSRYRVSLSTTHLINMPVLDTRLIQEGMMEVDTGSGYLTYAASFTGSTTGEQLNDTENVSQIFSMMDQLVAVTTHSLQTLRKTANTEIETAQTTSTTLLNDTCDTAAYVLNLHTRHRSEATTTFTKRCHLAIPIFVI